MMGMSISVDGKKGNCMVKGYILSLMEACTKAVLKMAKDMAKEQTHGRMGTNILENGRMVRTMDMVFSHGQMEKAILVSG